MELDEREKLYERKKIYEIFGDSWESRAIEEFLYNFILGIESVREGLIQENKHCALYYRGQSSVEYKLEPSISRNLKPNESILDKERFFINKILEKEKTYYCEGKIESNYFSRDIPSLYRLAMLQHHNCPTRLLDISRIPYIVLYFACCSNPGKDGEIIMFKRDIHEAREYTILNALGDSYNLISGEHFTIGTLCENLISQSYFGKLEQTTGMKQKNLSMEECIDTIYEYCKDDSMLIVDLSPNISRQAIQNGAYILFPNKICGDSTNPRRCFFTNAIEPISPTHNGICTNFIVPKELKADLQIYLSKVHKITEKEIYQQSLLEIADKWVKDTKEEYERASKNE